MTSAAWLDLAAKTKSNVTATRSIEQSLARSQKKCASGAISTSARRVARSPFRRRGRTRRRWGRAEIEIDGWRLFRAWLGGKEWAGRKAKHSGDHVGRKAAHGGIEVLHCAVEIISFDRDPIFRAFKLRLESEKILVRLQLRITFNHYEQTGERIAQLALRRLEFFQLFGIRRRFTRIELHPSDTRPRVGHLDNCRFLEIGRTLHRVYQIRNEIRAPLIDRLHVPPFLVHVLVERDKPVVGAPEKQPNDENDKKDDDKQSAATDRKFVHKIDSVSVSNRLGKRSPSQICYRPRARRKK